MRYSDRVIARDYLENKSHVIWDWNGTLLDDVDLAVQAVSRVLISTGRPGITLEDHLEIFCFPITEYYRRLGFDLKLHPFDTLSVKFIENYRAGVLECGLHVGARELIEELKQADVAQSILSAAHEDDLNELLAHFEIRHYFDRVYGLSNHHAASKVERGRELIADAGILPRNTILIGDTDHDLEVGKELGVDVLLLTGGHQSHPRLSAIHPYVHER
jgi:phosphoglycolate phosphatase